jgi:hypothetical protein
MVFSCLKHSLELLLLSLIAVKLLLLASFLIEGVPKAEEGGFMGVREKLLEFLMPKGKVL